MTDNKIKNAIVMAAIKASREFDTPEKLEGYVAHELKGLNINRKKIRSVINELSFKNQILPDYDAMIKK